MCVQCTAETVNYGEFAPGWYLVRATKTDPDSMDAGDWGLVECNDPAIIFSTDLTIGNDVYSQFGSFRDEMWADIPVGYRLYNALQQVKYPYAVKRKWVEYWTYSFETRLFIYLSWFANQNQPK